MTDFPLTFKCNNNCVTCINNTESFSSLIDPKAEEIKNIIEKINPNNDYLGFGGGEPTLRNEFFEILKYARKKHPHLYILLTTNGRIFSYKKYAKRLSKFSSGNFRVAVALYGNSPETHERITRCRGSFLQTVEGIKNLIHFKIPVEVRVIINRMNYTLLPNISKFSMDNFPGMDRFVFVNMKYTGNAMKNRDRVFVKISDVVPFVEKSLKVFDETDVRLFHFPLCTLPEKLRKISEGVTKREVNELTFVNSCERCKSKEECSRIWKSYVDIAGEKEFKAIG